jgi:hypothetical protein
MMGTRTSSTPSLVTTRRGTRSSTKRDPELAKFYEQEAKPVSIPVFGRNKNMTIQNRLYKDPHAAATYKIAEQVAQQWLASDKQAAEEQRKAAEAALAKLQSQIA